MSIPPSNRQLKHTRSIIASAYRRDDGLWEIEARLTDLKTRDFPLASGLRMKGDPVHDMTVRVTVDADLNILEAGATSDSNPYPGQCEGIAPAYEQLVGLNLKRGFRHAVRERLGGTAGCTHMTELTSVLPTTAIQAFAGEVRSTGDGASSQDASGKSAPSTDETRPFQIDRCHALRADGPAVHQYYPKWFRAAPVASAQTDPAPTSRPSKESA